MRKILVLWVAWGVAGSAWAAPLRVVSLNVQLGLGSPASPSFSLVARDLERIGADVVALQELQSDFQNIQALGSRLGLPYFYATNSNSMNAGVLSRYPLRSQEWINTGWGRAIPLVRPDLPNLQDDPWIAVVHLKCCGDPGGAEQQTRAAELYNLRSALLARGIGSLSRVVILGDFNLVSDEDAYYGTWPTFAPASADGYFPDEGIFKLPLRHVDGITSFTWLGSSQFQPRDMDHIMLSGALRDRNPAHEIYEPRKDARFAGRPKFGDAPAVNASYSADHLPIFADLVLRDEGDGLAEDAVPPTLGWNVSSNTLTFVNRPVTSGAIDVTATDDQDPAPVITVYPLNPTFTNAGTRKITYMARDRMGNLQTVDRTVTVAAWGANGIKHNLQWPPRLSLPPHGTANVYARLEIPGFTEGSAVAPNVQAWIGINGQNTDPATWPESAWKPASLNPMALGTADEYSIQLPASEAGVGIHYFAARWSIDSGAYGYGGISVDGIGGAWGATNGNGVLTVRASAIDWANLQWPPSGQILLGESFTVYARVYREGVTPNPGAPGGNFRSQIGVSAVNENPESSPAFVWQDAAYGAQYGNDDEFQRTLTGLAPGEYRYASRFSDDGGATWTYGGIAPDGNGTGIWDGVTYASGILTVGSTIGSWSSNAPVTSELVGKYAIGGATSVSGSSEKPVIAVDSNTLSLSAIVRTNDSKLTVVGEAGGSLTNWSTNGVSNTVAGSQAGVPEGHQRQVFSVDRTTSPTKLFLRLKATLLP